MFLPSFYLSRSPTGLIGETDKRMNHLLILIELGVGQFQMKEKVLAKEDHSSPRQ